MEYILPSSATHGIEDGEFTMRIVLLELQHCCMQAQMIHLQFAL